MPGRRGSERRALPGQMLVRLTAEAEAAVDAHAAAAGLTRAAWARGVIADAAALPVEDRRPVHALKRTRAPAEDLAAISTLAAWLNRSNGALIQLAAATREAGAADLRAETERVLAEHDALGARLHALIARLRTLDAIEEAPPEMLCIPGNALHCGRGGGDG